jgi:hypothetical protein
MASLIYRNFKEKILSDGINLSTDTLGVLLVDTDYAPDPAHVFVADVAAQELSGTGYVRKTLANKSVSEDAANNRGEFTADPVVWTAINAGTAKGAVLFKSTEDDATAELIAFFEFASPVATNGGDFTVNWSAEGILQLA